MCRTVGNYKSRRTLLSARVDVVFMSMCKIGPLLKHVFSTVSMLNFFAAICGRLFYSDFISLAAWATRVLDLWLKHDKKLLQHDQIFTIKTPLPIHAVGLSLRTGPYIEPDELYSKTQSG